MVSHRAVNSDAATRLSTAIFDRMKADPKLGRAEAMRQVMLAYLSDSSSRRNIYPAYGGPFALVGEGAEALKFLIVQCNIFPRMQAVANGRATTTAKCRKAPQHPIDEDQTAAAE